MNNAEKDESHLTNGLYLLPCPFCGEQPCLETRDVEPQGDPWYGGKVETFVLCSCGACLFDGYFHEGFSNDENRAVEAWNKRKVSLAKFEVINEI